MDANSVDMFIATHQSYFPPAQITFIRNRLMAMPPDQFMRACALDLKDPTTILLISIFLGALGIDRFMLNDVGMGILKLLTGGVCGVLWIIDICTIQDKTKEINCNAIMTVM